VSNILTLRTQMTTPRRIVYITLAVKLAFTASLYAQKAAPSAAAADESITLSPFEVRTEAQRGYIASETMSGTRVATQIKDLPYTVNVLTSEYFNDFGMFQLDDTLTQIGGLTGLDIGGSFNLRGFSSSSQLRDGFYRLGRYGTTNIDRLEIIKGPNAGIYGRTSPGGMVNMISKAPQRKESVALTARFGSYDTAEGILEATGSFDPNTYYILTVAQLSRGLDVDITRLRDNQAYLAIKHDFADHSHLLVSADYFLQYRHAPTSAAPMITDQKGTALTTDDQVIGYATNLAKYNAYGPYSELNRGSATFLASYDKQFGDIFSLRAAIQDFRARRWDYNQNTGFGSIVINSATPANNLTSTRGGVPNKGLIQEDGGGFQLDGVANYSLFNGAIKNKTLLTFDLNDYYRWDPTRNTSIDTAVTNWGAAGSGRIIALNPDYTPVSPLTYFNEGFKYGSEVTTRSTRRRTTAVGGLFRQESRWLNERLLTYFGGRFDVVRFLDRDYVTPIPGYALGETIYRLQHEFKPNVGALYKIKDGFRVYANYSESYFVDQTTNPIDIASAQFKPETAKGGDYGFKGSFFNDQLNYTIGGYYILRYNVSVTDTVETPIGSGIFQNITRRDGDQFDRGVEVDVNWNINKNYSTGLSYGHVNAKYSNFGSAFPQAVGRDVQNISPTNGSIYAKYAGTSGFLNGFSTNVGVTYVSATPTESPTAGDAPPVNGVFSGVSTYQWKLRVPSFTLWNIGFHYKWRTTASITQTFDLNINNAFDKKYLKVNKNIGDGRGVYFGYTVAFGNLIHH
jgi:iron complex outermembrane receptor protein